jgi:hypothetical protein
MSRTVAAVATGLLLAGCAMPSREAFDSKDFFTQPPEIWEQDGGYHLRLYEPLRDPTGFSVAETETVNGEIHVWVSVRHSSGSKPNRLISLGIPAPKDGSATRFFWRDPDGSLHAMAIRRK